MALSLSWALLMAACLLLIHQFPLISSAGLIGVNYGLNGDNLPVATDVINLYERCKISIVRIYEPNHSVLDALRGKPHILSLGTRNEDIQGFASDPEAASAWVNAHVVPYYTDVNIAYITVGNEVVPSDSAPFVANAIKNIMKALVVAGVTKNIKVTTVVSMGAMGVSYPPSAGTFTDDAAGPLKDIAQIVASSGAPILINVYPYFAYATDPQHISLEYALFTSSAPVVTDGELKYSNLFDAMVDSFYAALEKIGFPNVKLEITESGWPSEGNEPYTSINNAMTYNRNLMNHVLSGSGTPRRPNVNYNAMFFEMFNEDLKSAGVEQNFGFFNPDMQPVYPFWSCR